MVREVKIGEVLCRDVKGKAEFVIPTSMSGEQFMKWKEKNKGKVLSMLKITENEHSNINRKRRSRP